MLKPVHEKTAVPRYDRPCSHTLRVSVQMQPETRNDAKARVTSTYNAAADYFDAPALSFWDRIGQRTVERMSLKPGTSVLDACCGSGASAVPAAKAIGPSGRLLGVDLAQNKRVWQATLDYISKVRVQSVETNAVYAIARKPSRPLKLEAGTAENP